MNNETKLLEICAEIMGIDVGTLSLETSRDDLGEFDSLSVIQIIAEMEEQFDCTISEETIENVAINKIADFMQLIK